MTKNKKIRAFFLCSVAFAALLPGTGEVAAQNNGADFDAGKRVMIAAASDPIDYISVIGSRDKARKLAGSATYIGKEEIETFEYDDINRILRQAPGVNIQEEDGFGLRPNIGLRGTGTDRSSQITLLEDGILIAPAPYAAPAAYYFPTAARLSAVEVRKGSSAIKFGPRTTGGAINLVSTPIPEELSGRILARVGSFGLKEIHAYGGGSGEYVDGLVEIFRADNNGFKDLPDGGDTGFDIEDYVAKIRFHTPDSAEIYQSFEIKGAYYDQLSNETYLGITDEDFAVNPNRRYAASARDEFNSEHYQIQGTHYIEVNDRIQVTTVGYYNNFERDWFKLDDLDLGDGRGRISPSVIFADPDDPLNVAALAILRGEADSIDDALQLRHNAREYYSAGVQSVVGLRFDTGAVSHAVEISGRYHKDEEDRLQNRENFKMENGVLVPTSVDPVGSQANRVATGRSFSFFVQDEIKAGRWTVTPGVRFEEIKLVRTDFSTADPDREDGPTGRRNNNLSVFIPGIGVTFDATEQLQLIAGVHKGFSPPGPSDQDAQEEESVNFEAGFRFQDEALFVEAIGFYNDYSNLVGTCTASRGCSTGDIGDQFNGGKVDVVGLEFTAGSEFDLGNGFRAPVKVVYTYTDAEFKSSFSDGFFGDVTAGDELPYIPEHQLYTSVGVEYNKGGIVLSMNYVNATRNFAGQGPIPQLQKIDARAIFDLAAHYFLFEDVKLLLTIENLFDKEYIAARLPYGPRPGKPFAVTGGLSVSF